MVGNVTCKMWSIVQNFLILEMCATEVKVITRQYPRGIQILVSTYLLGAEFAGGGGYSGQVKTEKS